MSADLVVPPTIRRLRPPRATVPVHTPAVTAPLNGPAPLPDLVGSDCDLTHQEPADLGPCERCTISGVVAVAAVSWTHDADTGRRDSTVVCRSCLPDACSTARDEAAAGTRVQVDVPAWRAPDVPAATGISYRQLDFWVTRGYLFCEGDGRPGSGFERGRFLADEVAAARAVGALAAAGVKVPHARAAWDRSPAAALEVVALLTGTEAA